VIWIANKILQGMARRCNSSNIDDFFTSIAQGSVEGLRAFLEKGGNPNLRNASKCCLLYKVGHISNLNNNSCMEWAHLGWSYSNWVRISKGLGKVQGLGLG